MSVIDVFEIHEEKMLADSTSGCRRVDVVVVTLPNNWI